MPVNVTRFAAISKTALSPDAVWLPDWTTTRLLASIRLTLEPGVEVSGSVADDAGTLLADIEVHYATDRVRLRQVRRKRDVLPLNPIFTDEEGQFSFHGLPAGEPLKLFANASKNRPAESDTLTLEAGDVLIFSDVTVHQALPNRSVEIRQSFDARYQPASRAVAEKNLEPYAGTGTWEEVYAGWESSDEQYYWRELELTVIPFDTSYYERRDRMAFEMAEQGDLAARDALLRIVQRDENPDKRARAAQLLGDRRD